MRLHSSDGAAGIYVPEQGKLVASWCDLFRHGINSSFTLQIEVDVAESVLGELVKQVCCDEGATS